MSPSRNNPIAGDLNRSLSRNTTDDSGLQVPHGARGYSSLRPTQTHRPVVRDDESLTTTTTTLEQVKAESHPLLSQLLPKLRPFQREALEFAVFGKSYDRQFCNDNDNNEHTVPKKPTAHAATRKNDRQAPYHPKGRILCADEMGLGKTVTALAIASFYETSDWPLLILCPASLRYQWPNEMEKFLPSLPPSSVHVCAGFQDVKFMDRLISNQKSGNSKANNNNIRVVVVTYSLFQNRSAVSQTIAQHAHRFGCIIADESHTIKQKDSQRTQILLPILKQARRLILLSGTPALSRPAELWSQLHCLDPSLFGSWNQFTKNYCNVTRKRIGQGRFITDYSGSCNLPELHAKLRTVMVRRLKSAVLSELPPKQRTVVPISIMAKEERKICQETIQAWKNQRLSASSALNDGNNSNNFQAKATLMQAYQQTGKAKASAVADYLTNVWLPGSTGKILVFAHHKHVLDTIENAILKVKGLEHIRIDGSVPASLRHPLVRKFQSVRKCRVAVLGMTAAGVGLTLTSASTILFAELNWTPAILAQCEDRAHRMGQKASHVQILYMICQDATVSVDPVLWKLLGRKIHTLDQIVDGRKSKPYLYSAQQSENPALSVQEELTEFFATEDKQQINKPKKDSPAKGTIDSFFRKAASKNCARTLSSSSLSSNSKKRDEKRISISTPKQSKAIDLTSLAANPLPLRKREVAWTCSTCTLENSVAEKRSGWYPCEACGEPCPCTSSLKRARVSYSPHPSEVIVLEESGADCRQETSLLDRKKVCGVVVLDNDACEADTAGNCALTFGVSKNTGRVTIYFSDQPKLTTLVNFDMQEILADESADRLLAAKAKRAHGPSRSLEFHGARLDAVLDRVATSDPLRRSRRERYRKEIQGFVRSYLGLREVQKNAVKESEGTFTSAGLLSELMAKAATAGSGDGTERYIGGAKERAQENQEKECLTELDQKVLNGQACAWCAKSLRTAQIRGEATYCSEECAVEGRLRRGGKFASASIRATVFTHEAGKCSMCGIDAHSLYEQICVLRPAERLNKLLAANWKLPKSAKALEALLQNPKEGQFWQVDHIQAVAEGGGGCGLDNLRTLCVPCHSVETEKLRGRLKTTNLHGSQEGRGKQTDIRKAFGLRHD